MRNMVEHMHNMGDMNCIVLFSLASVWCNRLTRFSSVPTSH